jgi:FixJ family two-component response regulator
VIYTLGVDSVAIRAQVQLIATGMTNREIAAKLLLSRRTIDGHVERLFATINVSNRAQAAGLGRRARQPVSRDQVVPTHRPQFWLRHE